MGPCPTVTRSSTTITAKMTEHPRPVSALAGAAGGPAGGQTREMSNPITPPSRSTRGPVPFILSLLWSGRANWDPGEPISTSSSLRRLLRRGCSSGGGSGRCFSVSHSPLIPFLPFTCCLNLPWCPGAGRVQTAPSPAASTPLGRLLPLPAALWSGCCWRAQLQLCRARALPRVSPCPWFPTIPLAGGECVLQLAFVPFPGAQPGQLCLRGWVWALGERFLPCCQPCENSLEKPLP